MFDEFNEGNQIAKTTETLATVPAGSGFHSLNEDGTACSSDYYPCGSPAMAAECSRELPR